MREATELADAGAEFSPRSYRVADNEFERRRQTRRSAQLAERKLDALLVSFGPNLRYLTGFTGSNGNLLVLPGRSHPVHRPALPDSGRAGSTRAGCHYLPTGRWRRTCWRPSPSWGCGASATNRRG